MLVVYLKQGYFDCIDRSGVVTPTHFRECDAPMGSLHYNDPVSQMTPIESVYSELIKRNLSKEQVINALLWKYHRFRYFRLGYLAKRDLTIGFIGHRGSGKSASAAVVAIVDFLLNGYTVWSNMPIEVVVAHGKTWRVFRALPLDRLEMLQKDESFRRGVVVLDEVNVSMADASMYMSKTNRELSNFTQQMRKRGISIIWTAQNWNSVDPRMKFQTDYAIWCEDCYLRHPGVARYMGEMSQWLVMDVSGMSGNISLEQEFMTKYLLQKIVWKGNFHMRPWWHAYNTFEIQGKEPYSMKELEKQALQNSVDYKMYEIGNDPVARLIELAKSREILSVSCDAFWKENNITDLGEQTKIGKAFIDAGYKKMRKNRAYYWERNGGNGDGSN